MPEESEKKIDEKPKKSKTERIEEKKAERRAKEVKEKETTQDANVELSVEEKYEAKMRQLQLEKESDLKLAMELVGTAQTGIDGMFPTSREDFEKFETAISKKILESQTSSHYIGFLDSLFRSVSAGLEPEDIRRLSATLSTLAQEKQKLQSKSKPKKKGAKLAGLGKASKKFGDIGGGDEFDDFADSSMSTSKGSGGKYDQYDDDFM